MKLLLNMFAGIEIGGSKLQINIENDNRELIAHFRTAIQPDQDAKSIREIIFEKVCAFHKLHTLSAIGVGFGGPFDRSKGQVFQSFQVNGWKEFPFVSWFHEWINVPVFIENDANVAAIAEAKFGAGMSYRKVFYITLGSGVGSGFVSEGVLYEGLPIEMEFGHLRLDPSGTTVEQRCSGWGINKVIRDYAADHPSSLLVQLAAKDPGHEAKHLTAALTLEDPLAKKIFSSSMQTLAFALSHVIHLLGPDVIIIGGGLSLMGITLSTEVEKHLPGFLMIVFQPGPPVLIAKLGEEVVPTGAIEFAKQQLKKTVLI